MKIINGKDENLWWNAGDKGTRKRKANEPIKSVVWHWTGGSGDGGRIFQTLKSRGLSIHFTIDAKGVITQHCDPITTIAYHASTMNSCAIGIEITNPASLKTKNIHGRLPRDCVIRGNKCTYYDFLPAQYEAVKWLASYLSSMYQIPKEVLKDNKLYDLSFLKNYRGHLEHLHCSKDKVDAGGFVMDALEKYFELTK